jgi:hypothetical protein
VTEAIFAIYGIVFRVSTIMVCGSIGRLRRKVARPSMPDARPMREVWVLTDGVTDRRENYQGSFLDTYRLKSCIRYLVDHHLHMQERTTGFRFRWIANTAFHELSIHRNLDAGARSSRVLQRLPTRRRQCTCRTSKHFFMFITAGGCGQKTQSIFELNSI